ncbi:transcription antitermination factor NusB [Helicobacter didelphidarum]|uniref:Transcription antitermination protein NusB n=1 Tax=Helicobacter didelphidarum TaxID=2040648 RepID=A0A3D8IH95_9HELI|nr:transcription antitermination factor NusB [Helicobacter didelphidarum]RDU64044.1 transcription antitermination factor NusB [Helicobacter didelphidarum]
MATRKQAREAVIQLLYAYELGNDNVLEQAIAFLDAQKIRHKQQNFALSLLHGVLSHRILLMQVIEVFLKTWDIERLGAIEKVILSLGIYELLQTDTQEAIIINEAIELTKSFGLSDASKLINGILDSVAKTGIDVIADKIQLRQKELELQSQNTQESSKIDIESDRDSIHPLIRQKRNDSAESDCISKKQPRKLHSHEKNQGYKERNISQENIRDYKNNRKNFKTLNKGSHRDIAQSDDKKNTKKDFSEKSAKKIHISNIKVVKAIQDNSVNIVSKEKDNQTKNKHNHDATSHHDGSHIGKNQKTFHRKKSNKFQNTSKDKQTFHKQDSNNTKPKHNMSQMRKDSIKKE